MIIPDRLAQQWVDAWNARDLEALLLLYADDIQLRSPFAKVFAQDGTIRSKAQLREYWGEAMRRMPNLSLQLVAVYTGHQAMVLHYRDNSGRNVIETMMFNDNDKISIETACLDKAR